MSGKSLIIKLSTAVIAALLFATCSGVDPSKEIEKTWCADEQGWLLAKNDQNEMERFFAIGTSPATSLPKKHTTTHYLIKRMKKYLKRGLNHLTWFL